jgi:restriction endonuclease S subunit
VTVFEDYQNLKISKVALKDVTTCFKGKAVSKFSDQGNVLVINLSDMTETGILYENLRKVEAKESSLTRYILEEGDVLIASKGTVKKVAVFETQASPVIASANITVLRPTSDIQGYYIKLFLDSDFGHALLEDANAGKQVMNLSTEKIHSIEIPKISPLKQSYLIQRYLQGLNDYRRKISRAKQEWSRIQAEVEKGLY